MTTLPIRVLVVDDSLLYRTMISELLSADPGIEVVGTASDPYDAREMIKQLAPDVLTLDVEMPRMDGLTFLRNLMRLRPMPVVMVSSLSRAGAQITLDALALGAVDFIAKPDLLGGGDLDAASARLAEKIRQAASARVLPLPPSSASAASPSTKHAHVPRAAQRPAPSLIALGASLGGINALREVLAAMPVDAPPIVMVQHIPAAFSAPVAERLDACCALTVHEAFDFQPLLPGHAYLAPGGRHLRIARSGEHWLCRIDDGELVRRHRPSVDVLFASVARHAGARASAALLTGMGDDGARGLRALRDAGADTVAQDEASSVVWGMPRAAVALDAACAVLPLNRVAQRLLGADDS